MAPLVGAGSIYGRPSPPQAFERLSWQIWAPLAVYSGAEAELACFTVRELSVTVTPGDVDDVSAAAVPAKPSAPAIIAVAMTVVLNVVFIIFVAFGGWFSLLHPL